MSLKRFPLGIPCGCVRQGDKTTAIINGTFASRNKSVGVRIRSDKKLKTKAALEREEEEKQSNVYFLSAVSE